MNPEESIYRILTHKNHRCGPLEEERRPYLLRNLRERISKNEPIKIFQFWGGAKNPSLPTIETDLCEEKSLEHLFRIHEEVKSVYQPGLEYVICTGDARVEYANRVPHSNTRSYHESFAKMICETKFNNIFSLIPVSSLYNKNTRWKIILNETYSEIRKSIGDIPKESLERLLRDARKNTFQPTNHKCEDSGVRYISAMISEERADIYHDFRDYIRSYFIRFSNDYKVYYEKYLPEKSDCFLTSKCSISLYTVKKAASANHGNRFGRMGNRWDRKNYERLSRLHPIILEHINV